MQFTSNEKEAHNSLWHLSYELLEYMEERMTVAIITDSTGGLTEELAKKYNLKIIPLKIHWGEETLLDNVDITPDEFYKRLGKAPVLPTTSQPSMNDFLQAYKKVPAVYDSILVPLISSGISGTVDSAESAVLEYKDRPVKVVDSLTTGSALALITIQAANAVAGGASLDEVYNQASNSVQESILYFVVDTLKYLHKGGRIGGASRYFGSALQINQSFIWIKKARLMLMSAFVQSARRWIDSFRFLKKKLPAEKSLHR